MALWLLCCILLFITSRGYDWLSHQSWFAMPELSLPWLVLGGLGLAIASNYSAWQSLTTSSTLPDATDNLGPPTVSTTSVVTDAPAKSQPPAVNSARQPASISFKVATPKTRPSKTSL